MQHPRPEWSRSTDRSDLSVTGANGYIIHGLMVASEVEFPLPTVQGVSIDIAIRRHPRPQALPAPRHSRADDPDDPYVIEHWVGERLIVEFPGSASFQISRGEVLVLSDDTDDPDFLVHLLLDAVLPRVVALRGDLMLHASGAVGPSGRAHIVMGETGMGKSTLAAALAAHGWPLLDDDGIRLMELDGTFTAVPGYAGVRLLPDSAAAVVPQLQPGRPMAAGHPKRRFAVDGDAVRMARASAPVSDVYVLERVNAAEPTVERMRFADALSAITTHGYHLADEPTTITRLAFERVSSLAAAVRVWRLRCPDDLGSFDATIALLTRVDDAPAG